MKFRDLYLKELDRTVNPAVSASDLDEATIKVEIGEYVFTPEIINHLYKILSNIRKNEGSHTGIWINGYYGSGKSHFLKYVNYCLSPNHGAEALKRLSEAVASYKPMELNVEEGEMNDLVRWYTTRAKVDSVMFNIGTVHDANSNQKSVFTQVFWNEFNGMRGLNKTHLALAQYLEKALVDDGKYEEFLEYVASKGYDWKRNINRFSGSKLDLALQMAAEIDPHLSIEAIRKRVIDKDVNISVEAFAEELKEYVEQHNNKDYRIVFFVDEISQFIDGREGILLQLQEVVTRVCEVCNSQVWFACTAQQDLSQVIESCNIAATSESFGKIMGRFEVRASLQGTSPEYITQKRILDKKGEVEIKLEQMFELDKAKLDAQFVLPTTYQAFKTAKDFADYYPFVPYQFQLIMKVLDSFTKMNYVDKQVKGNERSLINITFSIAKETADMEVGEFISFDRFFGAMFQGSMQHLGQRAIANAREALKMVEGEDKQDFYRRVVNVLFMVCNLADEDKQQFSATIDNVVTLLMTKMDASKAAIKNDVAGVLAFLMDKAVIRKVKTETGSEIYEFYTEEESKVAQIISNQTVDSNTFSEELYTIISNHFGVLNNKATYGTRSFNVGANVDGKTYLSNNADMMIDFLTTAGNESPEQFSLNNPANHLVFFLYPLLKENQELRNNFLHYCRVQRFSKEPAISEERQRTKLIFDQRAKELYKKEILPQFQLILDACPIISGQNVLSASDLGTTKRADRYKVALNHHLDNLYPYAKLVDIAEVPNTAQELSNKALRAIESSVIDLPLSNIEKKVKDYLDRAQHDVSAGDVARNFAKIPYGWSDIATLYVLNELIRRHLYAFNYNNNPHVSREEIARNLVREANRFTIEKAKTISQEVLNLFIESWKHIFNVMTIKGSNDSTELYRECREKDDSALNTLLESYDKLVRKLGNRPFTPTIEKAIDLMKKWSHIRDHAEFFKTIIEARDEAAELFDRCKHINTFSHDQFDNYKMIIEFIDANRDNFSFLTSEQQNAVTSIKEILKDEEPWTKMPSYMKMKRTLEGQLAERKAQLIDAIKAKYNAMFDDLEKYALEVNVPRDKFDNRENAIYKSTHSSNFYALQNNANTGEYYEEQMRKINGAIPPPSQPYTTPATGGEVVKDPVRIRKVVNLNTRSNVLHNEGDVDQYLQRLKEQLMPHIDSGNDVFVN